ncbi:dihydrolipoyl dehydrogenase [Clostridium sp. DL1XJH146]
MLMEIKNAKLGTVGKISVNIGDEIEKDEELLTIETKKGSTSIKAEFSGIIKSIEVEEGDNVKINDLLFTIERADEAAVDSIVEENSKRIKKIDSDITIIGGGPGGYVAAIKAAKMGAKVVVVEKESLGGTCLNWGCIPTKALVRSAEVFNEIKGAASYGLIANDFDVDMVKVIDRKNTVVNRLVGGIEYLFEKNSIKLIKGAGKLQSNNVVEAETEEYIYSINSKNIILATGSETVNLPIPGANSKKIVTSKEILDMKNLPEKLTIIGGGVIGMEFAFIFASFGVKVSVVEYLDKILAVLDDDVISEIEVAAQKLGIKLYISSKVEEIIDTENNKIIVRFTKDGKSKYLTSDKILMAVGRKPYLENLGLDKAGIQLNDNKRGIKVNCKMQTNIENIYAIGDVTNKIQLAHVASHQGIVAIENIMGEIKEMDYNVVPSAIFTHPEIASVGLTERDAVKKELDIEVGKFPYAANGKALAMGDDKGFIKIVKDKKTNKILGASIVGLNAADLISTLTVAMKNGVTTEEITETIFAHPTTAEVIYEGFLSVEGGALHFAK